MALMQSRHWEQGCPCMQPLRGGHSPARPCVPLCWVPRRHRAPWGFRGSSFLRGGAQSAAGDPEGTTHSDGLGDSASLLPLSPSEPCEVGPVSLGHAVTSQSSSLAPGSLLPRNTCFLSTVLQQAPLGGSTASTAFWLCPRSPPGHRGLPSTSVRGLLSPHQESPSLLGNSASVRVSMTHLTLSWPLWVPRSSSPWTQDLSAFHLPRLPLPGLTPPPQGE